MLAFLGPVTAGFPATRPAARRARTSARRWQSCSAAAAGAEPAVVALANGLDRVLEREMISSPLPSGPPPQPVWKRPRLNGARRVRALAHRRAPPPRGRSGQSGHRAPSWVSSTSIGVTPIQCFCRICVVVASSESAYCWSGAFHHPGSNRARSLSASAPAQRAVARSRLARPCRRGRRAPDEVDGVVELLRPMPERSTLPRPSGQPSPSASSVSTMYFRLRTEKS